MNDEQRLFVDAVVRATTRLRSRDNIVAADELLPQEHLFMLTGDGGTGKSFTFNVILYKIFNLVNNILQELIARMKSKGFNVMTTASTGIAAALLFEGSTMHSKLRIPLKIDANTQALVDWESHFGGLLRRLDVLIIDEVSAAHIDAIKFIDRTLKSVAPHEFRETPFGGKVHRN